MSLNGLDDPAVQDAYHAAVIEAGGWFFLKYTSRDSVDLLGRGKGGVHEARAAAAKYEEASPLFGVLVYRRRKVLIKLVPESTSRVLLARTAVHFQDVVEKYSPYEALLEITSADALTDTSLAASFPLHTATPSASSSRLDEITEDGEDPGPARLSPALQPPSGSYFASQRHRVAGRGDQRLPFERSPSQSIDLPSNAPRPTSPIVAAGKTSVSQFLVRNNSGKPSITSLGSDSLASMGEYAPSDVSTKDTASSMSATELSQDTFPTTDHMPSESSVLDSASNIMEASPRRDASAIRPSTSTSRRSIDRAQTSVRPSTASQFNYDEALLELLKPKVKLGPRPVAAAEKMKRPTVASVSTMPAPYRLSMRKQEPSRPPSSQSISTSTSFPLSRGFPSPPPIPETPDFISRPVSRGSVKSQPSHKSTAMTPDKLRLMKAVELRKKQLRKSNPHAATFVPPAEEEVPAVPQAPTQEEIAEPEKLEESAIASSVPRDGPEDAPVAFPKADSGIGFHYKRLDESEGKRSIEEPVIEEPLVEEPAIEEQRVEEVGIEKAEPLEEKDAEPKADEGEIVLPEVDAIELPEEPPALHILHDSPSSLRRASPRLAIPGAFSGPTSPESELEEPTLDPVVHLDEQEEPKQSLSDLNPEAIDTTAAPPHLSLPDIPEIVMTGVPRPTTPTHEEPGEEEARSVKSSVEGAARDDRSSSNADLDAYEMSPKRKNSDLARRRQGFVEPMHVESGSDSSDDEFMHELQTATVQEAKPVMVSRSPVQPFFPRSTRQPSGFPTALDPAFNPRETKEVFLTSPKPADVSADTREQSPELQNETPASYQPSSANVERKEPTIGQKRNVSNDISRRIQALAGSSSRESSPGSGSRPMSPDLVGGPGSSSRSPTHSRNSSFKAFARQASKMTSLTGQLTPPAQHAQQGPVWSVQRDPLTNRESVSVTARIVRPTSSESVEEPNAAESEFQPTQLFFNHKRGPSFKSSSPQLPLIITNSTSTTTTTTKQDVTTGLASASPTLSRTSRDVPRNPSQTSQHKATPSPTVEDFPPPPDHNRLRASIVSMPMNDENVAPKESSRTSRFFKRMSNIGGKRRSGMQQVLEGGSNVRSGGVASAPHHTTNRGIEVHSIMPPACVIGDLNVQFPDSLLWKRRIISLDDSGNIKFALPQTSEARKPSSVRRFHLSEFRAPYVPDLDRLELPNSILMDFVDGGTTLQIACEDAMAQIQVSHSLKTYWRAWSAMPAPSALGQQATVGRGE